VLILRSGAGLDPCVRILPDSDSQHFEGERDSETSMKGWICTGLLVPGPGQSSWVFLNHGFDAWNALQENPSQLQSSGIY